MHMLLNSLVLQHPAQSYEVSPDNGMFVQAWNIRGINIPLIHYFFGIDPLAYKKEISLKPNFPEEWGNASIKNVIIGDNLLSVHYRKSGESKGYTIKMTKPHWMVKLNVGSHTKIFLNGKNVKPQNGYVVLKEEVSKVRIR